MRSAARAVSTAEVGTDERTGGEVGARPLQRPAVQAAAAHGVVGHHLVHVQAVGVHAAVDHRIEQADRPDAYRRAGSRELGTSSCRYSARVNALPSLRASAIQRSKP